MTPLFKVIGSTKHLWPYYLGILTASFMVALTGIAIPFVIKAGTDLMVGVVQGGSVDISGAILLASALLGFDVANTLIRNWGGYVGDVMAARIKSQLSTNYFEHLLSLPQSYFDGQLTGAIINRLNRAINEVSGFLNVFANTVLQMILTMVLTIGIVSWYSWELAALVAVIYPLFLWLTALSSKKWQFYQTEKNRQTDMASGRFAEVVSRIKVVKSYAQERIERRHFRLHFERTVKLTHQQSAYWHTMDVSRGLVLGVIFFIIYTYIFTATIERHFTIGEMVLLITLINAIRLPIFSMGFIVDSFQRALSGSRDYQAAMDHLPEIVDAPGAHNLEVTQGRVMYGAVNFGYRPGHHLLNKVSFVIEPGERVALVGESGEGKTTITNLLLRLYDPTGGIIAIDDVPIGSVTQTSLRRSIAVVFQDPALFSGTIRQNISYANPRASDSEIIAAAKAANAHEFIMKLSKGYDTEIGERGARLSAGERQCISIARAILKDAPILILDEATASLDRRTEERVQQALDRLTHGKTTLIIAHRLSTIANVDKIVTIKNGHVDEVGAPRSLARTDGIYAQLLKLQAGKAPHSKKQLATYGITE